MDHDEKGVKRSEIGIDGDGDEDIDIVCGGRFWLWNRLISLYCDESRGKYRGQFETNRSWSSVITKIKWNQWWDMGNKKNPIWLTIEMLRTILIASDSWQVWCWMLLLMIHIVNDDTRNSINITDILWFHSKCCRCCIICYILFMKRYIIMESTRCCGERNKTTKKMIDWDW